MEHYLSSCGNKCWQRGLSGLTFMIALQFPYSFISFCGKGSGQRWFENEAQVPVQSLSQRKRTKNVRLSAGLNQWSSMRCEVMRIHARWGSVWNLLIKGTVPSMTFCLVWLYFCSHPKFTCLNFICVQILNLSKLHPLHRPTETSYMAMIDEVI